MTDREISSAIEIVEEIFQGDWSELIKLQSMHNPSSFDNSVLNNVLLKLQIEKKLTEKPVTDKKVYLATLSRYFGTKVLNNGLYFTDIRDAKEFVKQYKEMMRNNSELQREDGEKIKILEIGLISDECAA